MRIFKYVAFWVLFILFVTALVWHEPLNQVGTVVPVGLIVCLVIALVYSLFLWFRDRRNNFKLPPDLRFRNFKQSQQSADSDLQAHSDLVRMCFGDTQKVERLIRHQQSKRPGLTRAQATRMARDQLMYDRQK